MARREDKTDSISNRGFCQRLCVWQPRALPTVEKRLPVSDRAGRFRPALWNIVYNVSLGPSIVSFEGKFPFVRSPPKKKRSVDGIRPNNINLGRMLFSIGSFFLLLWSFETLSR
jgi:hypothetical protein